MTTPVPMSATDADGDLFLSGTYVELGISGYGNFGTTQGETPAGYAQAGSQGVGLTFNAAGFGVNSAIPTIDFFTPGTPYEALAAGYTQGGTNTFGSNYKDGGLEGITATSLTDTSSGSTLSARWVGVLSGDLRVTVDYSFSASDEFFTTTVTLTNLSGAAMTDVRYDREVDPDNTEYAVGGSGYVTTNTIVSQEPGGPSEVTATSSTTDSYATATGSPATLAYYSSNPDARVADGLSNSSLDPFDPIFTSGANTTGADDGASDSRININFDGGALAAGASTSFNYITAVTNHIASVIPSGSAPAAPTLMLNAGSDSGTLGDGITNRTKPVLTGTSVAGSTVTIRDLTDGIALGTAVANSSGVWTFAEATALSQGIHYLSATASVSGGPVSGPSTTLTLTIDSVAPAVTAAFVDNPLDTGSGGLVYSPILAGLGNANATVIISANGTPIGSVRASATGAWSFDPTGLAAAGSSLVASETDAAGNTGTSVAISLTQPPIRFIETNQTTIASGQLVGSDYSGPVSYLQAQLTYGGSDDVVIGAVVSNAFLVSGSGDDALQALGGSNVLDGGAGSNWLVGATGADGGHDTFFVDARDNLVTWDTLLNFHVGDLVTEWGYSSATGSEKWVDGQGTAGYKGATLQTSLGAGGPSALLTFDGLSTGNAHFAISTGVVGGINYLAVTRTL